MHRYVDGGSACADPAHLMADRGGRKIEPLPRKKNDGDDGEATSTGALDGALPRLPTGAIIADAPGRLPSSAFVADDAAPIDDPRVLDDPSRMPSDVFKPRAPADAPPAARDAKKRAPRAAYVPPRLGQPMPRALRHTHPLSALVSQWLNSLVRTLRGMHMYADNNARRREYFDQTVAQLTQILTEVPRLELDVREDRIYFGADVVHYSPDPVEGLSSILHRNNLHRLELYRGITRLEMLRMLGALATDFSRPDCANEDLLTILARLGFKNLRAAGEAPAPAPPPRKVEPLAPARTPPPEVVVATPDAVFEPSLAKIAAAKPAVDLVRALAGAAALPVASERPVEQVTEPVQITATKLLASAGYDPFGDDDEVTVVPPKPMQPPRAPTPSVSTPPPPPSPTAAASAKPDPFADDEATLLCDTKTAQALAALIREESMPEIVAIRESLKAELTHDQRPPPIERDPFDEPEGSHDTLPAMQSPFAGQDDIPLPEIASDLVLPDKKK